MTGTAKTPKEARDHWPVKDLVADPANVRKHDAGNIRAIASSLQRFGQQTPIVIDKNMVVRKGNGTLEAALFLEWESIWAVQTDLQGSEATAYAIADNRSGELGTWDITALSQTLQGLKQDEVDVSNLGWDPHELDPMLQAEWTPPERGKIDLSQDFPKFEPKTTMAFDNEQRAVLDRLIAKVREDDNSKSEAECVIEACLAYLGD